LLLYLRVERAGSHNRQGRRAVREGFPTLDRDLQPSAGSYNTTDGSLQDTRVIVQKSSTETLAGNDQLAHIVITAGKNDGSEPGLQGVSPYSVGETV
jgi:hypothetical protein